MKLLIYTIVYNNKKNIINLIKNFENLKINIDFLIINNSPIKVNINGIRKKIKIFNNIRNNYYVGAFNQAIKYSKKKNYTHLIHINDDIFLDKNIFQKLTQTVKFQNSMISPTQCNSKKKIISNGSKKNFFMGNLKWEIKNKDRLNRSFAPQGSFFSIPLIKVQNFQIPYKLNNYCEETYIGYFFEKKIKSFFLTKEKFIHYGADKPEQYSEYKGFFIVRNNILILKKFSKNQKKLYIKLFFYICRCSINMFYKLFVNPLYSKSILNGIIQGLKNRI